MKQRNQQSIWETIANSYLWKKTHWIILSIFFQVDEMYREAPIKGGNFDYLEFTRILKHGKKDRDED